MKSDYSESKAIPSINLGHHCMGKEEKKNSLLEEETISGQGNNMLPELKQQRPEFKSHTHTSC